MDEFNFVPEEKEELSPVVNQSSGFSFTPETDDIDVSKYNAANLFSTDGSNVNTIEKVKFVNDKTQKSWGQSDLATFGDSISKTVVSGYYKIGEGMGNLIQFYGDNMIIDKETQETLGLDDKITNRLNSFGRAWQKTGSLLSKGANYVLESDQLKLDAETFQGSIVENPSLTRVSSVIMGAIPSLTFMGSVGKMTGSYPLAYYLMAGSESSDLYIETRDKTQNQEQANLLFASSTAGTALVDLALKPVEKIFSPETIKGWRGQVVKRISNGLSEGTAETGQQFWQNAVRKYGLDSTQNLTDGLIESGLGGLGAGAMMTGAYAHAVEELESKGATPEDIDLLSEVIGEQFVKDADGINEIISKDIDNSFTKLDDYITNNAEVLANEKMRKELQKVYDNTYELLSDDMEPVQAKYNAKLAQGWALFGAKETGLSPTEYMNLRFPKVTSAQEREMMAKKNLRRDIEKIKNPLLIKKTPALKSLSQFLKQSGGLQDFQGELKALGANEVRGLVKDGGIKLDEATRLAWENGYIQGQERPEINELLDALSEDIAGNFVYAEQKQESEASYIRQLSEDFDRAGVDIRNDDIDTVYNKVQQYKNSFSEEADFSYVEKKSSDEKARNEFVKDILPEQKNINRNIVDFIVSKGGLRDEAADLREWGSENIKGLAYHSKGNSVEWLTWLAYKEGLISKNNSDDFLDSLYAELVEINPNSLYAELARFNPDLYYQSAMYRNPRETIGEFVDYVNNNPSAKKSFYRFVTQDEIEVDVLSDTVIHDNKKHDLTGEQWQALLSNLDSIAAYVSSDRGGQYGNNAVLLKIDTDAGKFGVVIYHQPNGRNIITTAFKSTNEGIDSWMQKESSKKPSHYSTATEGIQTREVALSNSLKNIISQITINVKQTGGDGAVKGNIEFSNDSKAIIRLFENADASTFIHEMGHFFLRELNEFAKYSNDSKIRLAEVNKWLGADESGVYTREQEEMFARGFEQFVREGKAPSNYLKQVFNRFAEWLRQIYKSASELDVKLSDEVRQVYADLFGGKELDRYFDKNFQESFEVINKARFEKNNEAISKLYAQNLSRVTNQQQLFNKMVDKTSKITQDLGAWLENAPVPLEEPIRKIAPELFWKNRRLEIAKLNRTKVYHERIKGFIEGMEQIANKNDFYNLDLALKNRDETKTMEILERNNLGQEFKEVKSLLAELYHELWNVGVDVGHLDVYFPRRIKDANGLLNFVEMKYQGTEEYSMIEKALAEKQKDGRVLSTEDKAQLVNSLIRGYGGKITLSNIGNVKSREIDIIDGELNQFYKISTDALVDYVSGVSVLLEDKAYFGKESQELQKLRTAIRGRRTRIQEYQAMGAKEAKWKEIKRLNYEIAGQEAKFRNAFREEDKLDAQERKSYLEGQVEYYTKVNAEFVKRKTLERMNADVSELQAQLEKLDGKVIEESVGHLILNLVEQGKIKATEERRLRELLTARFSNKGLGNEALKFMRDGGYLFTLGNFESAITQLGDLGLSAYEAGLWNTFIEFGKAVVNKSEVTKEMVGLSNTIVRELRQDEGYLTKTLDKVLGWTGFEKLDRLGKQTLMNAAINKARSQAKENNTELDEYLKVAYGQNYTKVKQDLIAGEITPEIIEFALFKLMDVQPLTIDQMPSFYAEGGKKRFFYMLKSYSIKIINLYRGLVFEKARKDPAAAIKDMAMLTAYLMLFNAGADLLKDLLFGRKIDITDTMVDNMAMGGVFGKFQAMQAKREGLVMTFMSQMMPPVIVDTLFVDMMGSKDIEDWRTWNQIPLIGRFYYWYLGGGQAKKEQEAGKTNKNKRRNNRKRRED